MLEAVLGLDSTHARSRQISWSARCLWAVGRYLTFPYNPGA